ncbi:MAG: ribosomal protein S18 acetylase RimI-like enzyme [Gammaproteobacteria bacterium]
MIIRKATNNDLTEIKDCAVTAYQIYVERIGRKPAPMIADFQASIDLEQLYIADWDGKVAGFVVFYAKIDHVHLENIAVNSALQKKGIGLQLIQFVEGQTLESGFGRVELYTHEKMTENLGIYPRLGYREFDRRTEDGFDRVFFEKYLIE